MWRSFYRTFIVDLLPLCPCDDVYFGLCILTLYRYLECTIIDIVHYTGWVFGWPSTLLTYVYLISIGFCNNNRLLWFDILFQLFSCQITDLRKYLPYTLNIDYRRHLLRFMSFVDISHHTHTSHLKLVNYLVIQQKKYDIPI